MELQIEKWVNKTRAFSKESKDLFDEAVKCYKVGANRAAFTMSYLAFEKEIQVRILNFTTIPNNISEEEWNRLCENLQNENEWEKTIFKEIIQRNKIMNLPNRSVIEKKLQVYKVTRNACTHANGQTINSATVEELWNFIRDNMQNFNVNGGKEYFKVALYEAFRDRNEDIEIDYNQILESMKYSKLEKDELIEIWEFLYKKIHKIDSEDIKKIWNEIIYSNDEKIQNSLIEFLRKDSFIFAYFYKINKDILNLTLQAEGGIKFRKEVLYEWINEFPFYKNIEIYYWDLIIELLKNRIHKSDRENFIISLNLEFVEKIPTREQTEFLKEIDFFDICKSFILKNLEYDEDELSIRISKIGFIIYMIKNGFNDDLINHLDNYIRKIYTNTNMFTISVRDEIQELLLKDRDFINQIVSSEKYSKLSAATKGIINIYI